MLVGDSEVDYNYVEGWSSNLHLVKGQQMENFIFEEADGNVITKYIF